MILFNTAGPACIFKYFLSCTYITFQKPKSLVNVVKPLQINNPKLRGYISISRRKRTLLKNVFWYTRLLVLANRYVKTFLSEHFFSDINAHSPIISVVRLHSAACSSESDSYINGRQYTERATFVENSKEELYNGVIHFKIHAITDCCCCLCSNIWRSTG